MFRISMTAALLATGGAAFAQDARFERYGDAGGWTIFADTESGGCFIEKAVGDYVVQMGSEATIIGDGDGADFA